jgi:cytochrome c-type biogenesis protein CcmF
MTAELGAFALILALALSALQAGLSVIGRVRGDATLRGAGEGAGLAAFVAVAIAFAALMTAFVTSDFSVANVVANSNTDQPLFYRVTATWGSHEGSMLLWNLALTGFGACVILYGRGLPTGLKSVAVATQGTLATLFVGYTVFASNPFVRIATAPLEGRSLNPILQDPFMAIHPPILYCGYVGFSVVFSLAVAALVEGRVDAAWARWVRPWALAAWSLLTVGITLGSFWAYYELGWGGWWFWDPVENASFMPWLVGTALLHSAIVTEKRILGLAAGAAFGLFAWRAPKLTPGGLFAPISREGALVLNNLFLAAATACVMLGTLYPLIVQAVTGEAISVGGPYFALTFGPLMVACLLILPAGPLLAWKRGDLLGALQRLWIAAVLALAAGLFSYAIIAPRKVIPVLVMTIGFWLIAGSAAELAGRLNLGALGRGDGGQVWRRLKGLPLVGLGVFVLGAACELSWRTETAQSLSIGQSMRAGAYTLTLQGLNAVEGPNFSADQAMLLAKPDHGAPFTLTPERRFYAAQRQTTSKVAIQRRGVTDVYVVLGDERPAGGGRPAWLVRVFVNPWARLIFAGPLLMALGGGVSLSDRRIRLAAGRRATSSVLAAAE